MKNKITKTKPVIDWEERFDINKELQGWELSTADEEEIKSFIHSLVSEPTKTKPEIEKLKYWDLGDKDNYPSNYKAMFHIYQNNCISKINEIIDYLSTKDKKEGE